MRNARPVLPNSPLTEVVCELRLHGELSVLATWGAFQREVRKDFPKLYVPGAVVGQSPLLQPVRLTSEDEQEQVMLAVNTVAYSVQKYENFPSFRAKTLAILEKWHEVCGTAATLIRLGLRYINRLPPSFPGEIPAGIVHPCLKLRLDGWSGLSEGFVQQPRLGFVARHGRASLRVALEAPEAPPALQKVLANASLGVAFDLDAYVDAPFEKKDIPELLDQAHDAIDDGFFGMITDGYKLYLEGRE